MNNNIRRGYLIVGCIAIISITLSFIARDLAWSGQWTIASNPLWKKSSTMSAPWPSDHWASTNKGVTFTDQSVYMTVRIPRRFDSVAVMLDTSADIHEIFVASEQQPNTLRYNLVAMLQSPIQSQWSAILDLSGVAQHRGTINILIRIPSASTTHPVNVNSLVLTFHRPARTFTSFIQSVWGRIQ